MKNFFVPISLFLQIISYLFSAFKLKELNFLKQPNLLIIILNIILYFFPSSTKTLKLSFDSKVKIFGFKLFDFWGICQMT